MEEEEEHKRKKTENKEIQGKQITNQKEPNTEDNVKTAKKKERKYKCECMVEPTVEHIILECNDFKKPREEANMPKDLKEALNPRTGKDDAIFKFIQATGLDI